jgi:hypothetical protein
MHSVAPPQVELKLTVGNLVLVGVSHTAGNATLETTHCLIDVIALELDVGGKALALVCNEISDGKRCSVFFGTVDFVDAREFCVI